MDRHACVNRLYRLVWNEALNVWMAVAEIARGRGKSGSRRRRVAALATLSVFVANGPGAWAGGNRITPDGRTDTSLSTSGNVTDVRTGTTSGTNAFNSFSTFTVGGNQVVNMHLPGGSTNLINLVTDSRATINGMLNSIRGNKIGGNVYFASPHGFLVGAGGVVNVGSLTVSTPTRSFVDSFFTATGEVDALSLGALLDGSAPDQGGAIDIDGKVNVSGGVKFRGGSVRISGTVYRGAKFVGLAPDFSDVVNANGLASGTRIVEVDGRLRIVAEGDPAAAGATAAAATEVGSEVETGSVDIQASQDVTVSGAIRNEGRDGVGGGQIAIQAGNNITLEAGAHISAAGQGSNSGGGSVTLLATNNAVAQSGALVDSSAGVSGNAGFIEFSAKNSVELAGGQFRVSATQGQAGAVLIDPTDLVISANYYSDGGTHTFSAPQGSITVASGISVSSRNVVGGAGSDQLTATSAGNSGNLVLEAARITLGTGSQVVAHADNGFAAGDVILNASRAPGSDVDTGLPINGGGTASVIATGAVIRGANVTINASSTHDDSSALIPLPVTVPTATATVTLTDTEVTAGGALSVNAATSVDTTTLSTSPLGTSVVRSIASVDVGGSSVLTSGAATALSARSEVSATVRPGGIPAIPLPADAAVAITTIDSNSTVRVGGTSQVNATGALSIAASNAVTAENVADASTGGSAAVGGTVAVAVVNAVTRASIEDAARTQSSALSVTADSRNTVTSSSRAAAGGATKQTPSQKAVNPSETEKALDDYKEEGKTSSGSVDVAAAVAVASVNSRTQALVGSTAAQTSAGSVTVSSLSTSASTVEADGSTVGDAATVGVGAAVAINIGVLDNSALIADNASVSGNGVTVRAGTHTGETHTFSSASTSGAGASSVGVAGSLAVGTLVSNTTAALQGDAGGAPAGATVNAGAGEVRIEAVNATRSTVSAGAEMTGSGDTARLGVGASVGVNVGVNTTLAEVGDGAVLTGGSDMVLNAQAEHEMSGSVEGGAGGARIAVTPVAAVTVGIHTTTARLGSGAALNLGGSYTSEASQSSSQTTGATGATEGSQIAVGASLALGVAEDTVVASIGRDLTAAGDIGVKAASASRSDTSATASVKGGKEADENGEAASGESVDEQVSAQGDSAKDSGKATATKSGQTSANSKLDASKGKESPKAESGGQGVSVAAAVGVNAANNNVSASVADGVTINSAGGALHVGSTAETDARAKADGSQVDAGGTNVGVGAAAAVNAATSTNQATVGTDARVSTQGLSVRAEQSAGETSDYGAEATSGAGASRVGVAGSLAVNAVVNTTAARVGATGAGTGINAGAGDVEIVASSASASTVKAGAVVEGTGGTAQVGVGASVGVNVGVNTTLAELANAAVLNGGANMALKASAEHGMETEVTGGAGGARIAVTPVAAVTVGINTTTARLGTGAALNLSGGYDSLAEQSTGQTTVATGQTRGNQVAIGASLALGVAEDTVVASIERNLNATGDVDVKASGTSKSDTSATASVKGGQTSDGNDQPRNADGTDSQTVDEQVKGQGDSAKDMGRKTADSSGQTDAGGKLDASKGKASPKAETSQGGVSVAAAIGVNVADSSVGASVARGVTVHSTGGALNVGSMAETDARSRADGSQVDASRSSGGAGGGSGSGSGGGTSVGVGAAVALNVATSSNTATVGDDAVVTTQGLSVKAEQASGQTNDYGADAKSGAGASSVGVAGSLALNVVTANTRAALEGDVSGNGTGASVDAGAGNVEIVASSASASTVKAVSDVKGSGSGSDSKVGVGASVGVHVGVNTTVAEVANNALLRGGTDLALRASAEHGVDNTVEGGAAGAKVSITPVVAVSVGVNTTQARVGSAGSGLNLLGEFSAEAEQSHTLKTTAKGAAQGDVAVGAALVASVAVDDVGASLARDVDASTGLRLSSASETSITTGATASAKGAKQSRKNETTGEEETDAGESVDEQKNTQLNFAKGRNSSASGVNTTEIDSKTQAKTPDTSNQTPGTSKPAGEPSKEQQGKKVSVAAAIGVGVAFNESHAEVGEGLNLNAGAGELKVEATSDTNYSTRSSGEAVSDDIGVGVAVSLTATSNRTEATIASGTTVSQAGDVTVNAQSSQNRAAAFQQTRSAEAVSGASGGEVAVAGALAVVLNDNTTRASIDEGVTLGSTATPVGAVSVTADDTSKIAAQARAGAISTGQGSKAGVGASFAVLLSNNVNEAVVGRDADDSGTSDASELHAQSLAVGSTRNRVSMLRPENFSLSDIESLDFDALDPASYLGSNNYYTEAVAGAASTGNTAVAGSFAVNVFRNQNHAAIGENVSATTVGASGVNVSSLSDSQAIAFTGAVAGAKQTGVGISNTNLVSLDETTASIGSGSDVRADGAGADVSVSAESRQDLSNIGVSASASTSGTGVGGVLGVMFSLGTTEARVADSATVKAGGDVSVTADTDITGVIVAGGVGAAGTTGVGASVAANILAQTTRARIGADAEVSAAGQTSVAATAEESSVSTVLAGAGAGTTAVAGALSVNVLVGDTQATIGQDAQVNTDAAYAGAVQGVSVRARDDSTVVAITGGGAGGGTTGVGAALDTTVSAKTVKAGIDDDADADLVSARVSAARDVVIDASASEDLVSVTVGFAGGGTTGVGGAVSVGVMKNEVEARIGEKATVDANGNVGVNAQDDISAVMTAGAAAGGGTTGVGGSLAVATLLGSTRATIGDEAVVNARGLGDARTVYSGETVFSDTASQPATLGAKQTESARGLSVTAYNREKLVTTVASGAGGGTTGVAATVSANVIANTTEASIGRSALINQDNAGAGAQQQVRVKAIDETLLINTAGGAAGGGTAGVGAAANVGVIAKNTTASIGRDSVVNAVQAVELEASSSDLSVSTTVGLAGGGSVGVGGSVGGVAVANTTRAFIEDGTSAADAAAVTVSGGDLTVAAEEFASSWLISGGGGGGGAAGVGAALSVAVNSSTTEARIGNFTQTDATGTTAVTADSTENVNSVTVAGAGGGSAGVAGSIAVNVVVSRTEAAIGQNARVNQNLGGAAQDVDVSASDRIVSVAIAGAGAGGGAAGVGVALDATVVQNRTIAAVGQGAQVDADRDVKVEATGDKSVNAVTVAGSGGGAAGVSGAVSIIAVGLLLDSDAREGLGGRQSGVDGETGRSAVGSMLGSSAQSVETKNQLDSRASKMAVGSYLADTAVIPTQNTQASIGASARVDAGRDVTVAAEDKTTAVMVAGVGAGGGAAGVGGSVGVVLLRDSASATVGNGAVVDAGRTVTVDAETAEAVYNVGISGAGGGAAAVMGSIAVNVVSSETVASIGDADINQNSATGSRSVLVGSRSDTSLITVAGAGGGAGAAAVGGVVNVNVLTKDTRASIGEGATVEADRDVAVKAASEQAIIGASISIQGAGAAAVGVSVATNVIDNNTEAFIGSRRDDATKTAASVDSSGNVVISAADDTLIVGVAASGTGAGAAAVGGTVSVNVVSSETRAYLGDQSSVIARGIGADAMVYDGAIDNAATRALPSRPAGQTGSLDVDNDGVAEGSVGGAGGASFTVRTEGDDGGDASGTANPSGTRDSDGNAIANAGGGLGTRGTAAVSGFAVTAVGSEKVVTTSIGIAGAGAAGVTLGTTANVISSLTEARIGDGAQVNQGGGTVGDVRVSATDATFMVMAAGTVAGAAGAAISGSSNTAVVNKQTLASVGDADVHGAHVAVAAAASEEIFLATANVAGAIAGVGAAVSVATVQNTTRSGVEAGANVDATGDLRITAGQDTSMDLYTVAGAGGVVGVSGAVSVGVVDNTTQAYVEGAASPAAAATLNAGGTTEVAATSEEDLNSITVSAAAGGVGVAGSVGVKVLKSETTATIGDNTRVNQTRSGAAQDVTVSATDTVTLRGGGGTASFGGFAAAGAMSDTNIVRNTTTASIGSDAVVDADRDVGVSATSQKQVDSVAVAVAVGGFGGVAGAVSVAVIGTALDSESQEGLGDGSTAARADSQMRRNDAGSELDSGDSQRLASVKGTLDSRSGGMGVGADMNETSTTSRDRTQATVGESTRVTAGRNIDVTATDRTQLDLTAAGAGGGFAGIGAAVGVGLTHSTTEATVGRSAVLEANSDNIGTGNATVSARSHNVDLDGSKVTAGAGAGGVVGLSAAVSVLKDSSVTRAQVGDNARIERGSQVTVSAQTDRRSEVETVGVAAGGLAVGASVAVAEFTGQTSASLGSGVQVGQTAGRLVGNLSVTASDVSRATASAIAGSAGILSGAGADATARVGSAVSARVGANADVRVQQLMTVNAQASPGASAESYGVSAGLAAVGVSLADASFDGSASATVGAGSDIAATSLAVRASTLGVAVDSFAAGASGGLVGINGADSQAEYAGSTTASIGDNSSLTGNVEVSASTTTAQTADATGVSGGFIAGGAVLSEASSQATTTAALGNNVTASGGNLVVSATGTDTNNASATAGSGGVVSGVASKATTRNTSVTTASVGSGDSTHSLDVDALQVNAAHQANFNGEVDSVNASLVGASGASAVHTVAATVAATVADNARINASDVSLRADNRVRKDWLGAGTGDAADWNVRSGSGGLIDAPAGSSVTHITQVTDAHLGDGAQVNIQATSGTETFSMDAYNEVVAHDKVKLDSGGAIAVAKAVSKVLVDRSDATVSFGENSRVVSDLGNIAAGSRSLVDIETRAAADTYGLAGAPSGEAYSVFNGNNTTEVKAGALLHASDGEIFLAGGQDTSRSPSSINVHSKVNLWNKTAIPIATSPDARSTVLNNATVRVNAGSVVEAAGDISLYADRGTVNATASGIGKDIYREAASEIASGISNLFGGDDVSFDITGGTTTTGGAAVARVDGIARTGINRFASLALNVSLDTTCGAAICHNADGSVRWTMVPTATDGVAFNTTFAVGLAANIQARIDRLRALMVAYAGDPVAVGAYQAEINFLQFKLVELGLAGRDASGNFVAGAFNSPSPREQAQSQLMGNQSIVFEYVRDANTAAAALSTATGTALTHQGVLQTSAGTVQTSTDSSVSMNGQIDTLLRALSGFDATNATYQALTADIAENTTLASGINTARLANATDQALVNTQRTSIGTLIGEIQMRETAISGLVAQVEGGSLTAASQIVTLQGEIDSRQTQINTLSADIETRLTTIAGRNTTIRNNAAAIVANNSDIATRQAALRDAWDSDSEAGEVTTINARMTDNAVFTSTVATASGVIGTRRTNVASALTTVSAQQDLVNAEVTAVARGTASEQVATLATQLPTLSTTRANGPTADFVEVDDITVRLGSIRTKGDRLEGTGQLRAPGDATINITNNTPNYLVVNNLTIESNDGGTVSHNGILVNSNADINRINVGGSGASFGAVLTRDTTGAPAPSINITSNYDPNSPLYANLPAPAPDIDLRGDITNLRGSVNVLSEAGSILTGGSINAGTVNIRAKNGDFVQSYVDGFSHVGGDPASIRDNGTPLGTGIVANGSVVISARFLNVNSTVQSGIEQWNITLPAAPLITGPAALFGLSQSALDAAVTAYGSGGPRFVSFTTPAGTVTFDAQRQRLEASLAYANADRLRSDWATRTASFNGLYPLVSDYGNIGVFYDPANVRYEVNGTAVRGGYIQLYGQIMNTGDPAGANAGRLRVLDGYGQIRITNPTGLAIVINNLDTGSDPTGTLRGTAGKIDITDIQGTYVNTANLNDPLNGTVSAIHSVYTRDYDVSTGAASVRLLRETGRIEQDGSFTVASSTNGADARATDGRNTSYAPQSGLRYVWTTGTDDSTYTYWQFSGAQFLGIEALRTQPTGSVESRSGPFTRSSYRLMDGTYLRVDTANTANRYLESTNTFTTSDDWLKTAEWTNCNWWTLCIAQDYHSKWTQTTGSTSITTKSLKADYPIGIEFIGFNQGTVAINSASDVLLKGQIRNASGSTSITAGVSGTAPNGVTPLGGVSMANRSIIQVRDEALIRSRDLDLAASGSVGGALGTDPARAIATSLTGTLNASAADGNVRVHQTLGNLNVGRVTAGGSSPDGRGRVYLQADGSILAASPLTSLIQGQRVELTSDHGAIGSTASPLAVNVGHTDDLARRVYYGFKGSAQEDIGIRASTWSGNAAGNLLLDTVVSTGGDVRIEAPGRIIDNNPIEQVDQRTWDQLVDYWDTLGLREGTTENLAKQAQAVRAFEFGKTSDYRLYWQIRNRQANPAVYDPAFVYVATTAERDALTAAGSSVAIFEADRTARYHQLDGEVGGLTGSFSSAYAYEASTTERDAILRKASWTEQQLGISVTPGLLKNLTSTDPVIKSANVSGRTVTLVAGGAIGETAAEVVIPTSIRAQDLTAEQKVALAAGERSDVVITDGEIRVSQVKPVRFDAVNAINATVAGTLPAHTDNGRINLASQGDARLGTISAPGETRIKVRGSIINAAVSSVNTGDLILEAANGGIGHIPSDGISPEVSQPLNIALRPGATFTARAAGDVDVVQTGNLLVDTVFSRGDARLTASDSILDANADDQLNVLADNVTLVAQGGSVGTAGNALDVGVELVTDEATGEADAGRITARSATGFGVFLNGPLGGRFNIGDIDSGAGVGLTADLAMRIDGAVSGSGDFNLVSGGTTTFTAEADVHSTAGGISVRAAALDMKDAQRQLDDGETLASGVVVGDAARLRSDAGVLDIETTGDARITGIQTGNGTAAATRIVSTAGRVLDSGDTRLDVIADAVPAATLDVAGRLGVGSDGNPLDIRVRNLLASSTAGSVALNASGDVNVQSLQAGDAVRLDATGNITGSAVGSTGLGSQGTDRTVTVTSSGGSVTLDTVTGTQDVTVRGQTGVNTGTVTSSGGSVTLVSAAGNIVADRTEAARDVTLGAPAGSVTADTITAGGDVNVQGRAGVATGTVTSTGGSVMLGSAAGNITADRTVAALDVTMNAPVGTITAGFTQGGRNVALRAGGQITTGTTIAGGDLVLDSENAGITADEMRSGRGLTIDTVEDIAIDNLTVGGNLSLTSSRGRVDLGTGRARGDAELNGQQGVSVERLTAGSIALASSRGSVEAGVLQARGGDVTVDARRNIDVGSATAQSFSARSTGGNIAAGVINADEVTMAAPGNVTARSVNVGREVNLAGQRVVASIRSTGSGDVGGSITGFGGGMASDVQLRLNTPYAFRFSSLFTSTGHVDIPAGDLSIDSLWVGNRVTLSNPQTRVLIDQNDRSIQPYDVQLYSGGAAFPFSLVRNRVSADALVIHRSPVHEVLTPNGNNISAAELADRELALLGFMAPLFPSFGTGGAGGASGLVAFTGTPVQTDDVCKPWEEQGSQNGNSFKCKEDQK